jgi:hypothetical protein
MQKFKIGRNAGPGPLVPAFDLVRGDDGRILIQNVSDVHGPSDTEQTKVLRVLTSPLRTLGGSPTDAEGRQVDTFVTLPPGTAEHFEYAVRRLPIPFGPMPR